MKKTHALIICAFLLLLQSCNNENEISTQKSKVTFSLNTTDDSNDSKGRKQSSELAGKTIVLNIETAAGEPVLSYYYIPLLAFGDDFVSQQIELVPGNYVITNFMVVDNNSTVLFATPYVGSPLSDLVIHPLPFSFNVSANNLSSIEMDVVPVNDHEPTDFGYAAFKVKVVRPGTPSDSLNLLSGGNMGSEDEMFWNKLNLSVDAEPLSYQFGASGGPSAGDGAGFKVYDANPGQINHFAGGLFYQPINLAAGDYKFSADIKFGGQSDSNPYDADHYWFEFFLEQNEPIENTGLNAYTMLAGINGWVGGEKDPIDGRFPYLDEINRMYPGLDTETGIFTVNTGGTYYFIFQAGVYEGSFGPNGIIVDNVKLVKVN